MASLCKSHFLQQLYRKIDGAVLRSQNERNLDCAITFQTHSILQRFMLRFDLLQLDCNDHLFVYDGAHAVGSYKADLSCRNTKTTVGAIYTRTNFVTLKYVTDGWGTESNGFKLIITAVKDPKHACKDFRCTLKEFCVDNDLVCDGVNHCFDGSDEEASNSCTRRASLPSSPVTGNDSGTILGMSVAMFAAVAVGTLLALCASVATVVLCICRRQRAVPSGAASSSTASANAQSQQQQLLSSANSTSAYPLHQIRGWNGSGAGTMGGMNMGGGGMVAGGATIVGAGGGTTQVPFPGATRVFPPGNLLLPAGRVIGYCSGFRAHLCCLAK
ncbi:neuropilin and tolloid-like protein 2 isoform X2 [Ischnura elegans]|uniref:neuropilin and tolloid-like protein 2 isoform X2 n=1 Tax=Ischnura elegans TaxID=197161 RepID=UPI001ED86CD0|nr:neuropilin and tolloid-like protein 2 isoform X2 [Ischnura elegans]